MTDKPPRESWQSLQDKPSARPAIPASDTPEEMVMRAVISGPGKELLDWLRAETIEKRTRQNASDADLRWDEAQRALVARIETMRDRGIEISAERNKKPT